MKKIFFLAILIKLTIFSLSAQENKAIEGEICPEFSCVDIDSNIVSLNDFKDNLIIIDLWTTWCGPCKKEIPYLMQLEKKFSNEPIKFISISLDKNKIQWENFLKRNLLKGVQLYGGADNSVKDIFDVKYIPRFVIIDFSGAVINLNAPRPSSTDELYLYIKDLLALEKEKNAAIAIEKLDSLKINKTKK